MKPAQALVPSASFCVLEPNYQGPLRSLKRLLPLQPSFPHSSQQEEKQKKKRTKHADHREGSQAVLHWNSIDQNVVTWPHLAKGWELLRYQFWICKGLPKNQGIYYYESRKEWLTRDNQERYLSTEIKTFFFFFPRFGPSCQIPSPLT